ncbi:UbiX family flavin prenyltransferase [Sulfurospirillum sp. 1612]|uniref:UbiX family flavin prenyltransferase n=1 Tax=Sulfurospirillum sp. 1612 TaxID=3094835 RepID=UPI002F95A2AF
MKLIIGISGASGVKLGEKFIKKLPKEIEKYIIFSENATTVLEKEENRNFFDNHNIAAPIASGSFGADAMIVVPCSMNTVAKIACGISDNLITRSAAVMIKEKKHLVLAPREMPFSSIALENMLKLSNLGVLISPPILGYYAAIRSLEDMENFLIGKWFDALNINHNLFQRWEG